MKPSTRKRTHPLTLPTPAEEAAAYIRGLERRRELALVGTDPLPPGVSQVVEVMTSGAKRVKRKRFR